MLIQFHKQNIAPEWQGLAGDFHDFIFDLSPNVLEMFRDYSGPKYLTYPNSKSDLCNLRYGFECGVGWEGIIREFFTEMDALMKEAKEAGHEFYYRPFILKAKFKTCSDQGDIFGRDAHLYRDRYRKISQDLYEKSKSVEQYTHDRFKN
jgi:hypothetical protein